jgi:hypothetical protein
MSADLQQKNSRWMLVLLLSCFALPVVIVLILHKMEYHPKGQSNGMLIQPPIALKVQSDLMLPKMLLIDGVWNAKWNMVYVQDNCDKRCADQLYMMRQIHLSLAKEIERVQRVWITSESSLDAFRTQYPDLIVLNNPPAAQQALTEQFLAVGKTPGLYLVDPLGNVVMYYPEHVTAKAIRQDILKLLKFSWAG